MSLAKRQVHIAHIGCQPNGQIMAQVARNLTDAKDGFLDGMEYYVCDHDPLFTKEFSKALDDSGVEVIDSLRSGLRPISALLRRTRVGCPQQREEQCVSLRVRRMVPRAFGWAGS